MYGEGNSDVEPAQAWFFAHNHFTPFKTSTQNVIHVVCTGNNYFYFGMGCLCVYSMMSFTGHYSVLPITIKFIVPVGLGLS